MQKCLSPLLPHPRLPTAPLRLWGCHAPEPSCGSSALAEGFPAGLRNHGLSDAWGALKGSWRFLAVPGGGLVGCEMWDSSGDVWNHSWWCLVGRKWGSWGSKQDFWNIHCLYWLTLHFYFLDFIVIAGIPKVYTPCFIHRAPPHTFVGHADCFNTEYTSIRLVVHMSYHVMCTMYYTLTSCSYSWDFIGMHSWFSSLVCIYVKEMTEISDGFPCSLNIGSNLIAIRILLFFKFHLHS